MESTLIFVRHAETDLAGTFCGRSDPPLNDHGRRQLRELVENLGEVHFDAIYTSTLGRAVETARMLDDGRVPIYQREGLRQIDFGRWETLTWEAIEAADPAFAIRWVAEFPHVTPPEGEPIALFKNRVMEEIGLIRQEAEGKTVAVVTHSTVLRVLLEEVAHFSAHHAWERTRAYACVLRCKQKSATGYLEVF